MIRSTITALLAFFGIATAAWSAPKLEDTLAKPIAKEVSFEPKTPLNKALELLCDLHDVTMIIDDKAFEKAGVKKVEVLPIQLPKLVNVQLRTVLQLLLNEIDATYLVKRDYLEIVPRPKGKTLVDSLPGPTKEIQALLKKGIGKELRFDANTPLKEALAFLGDVFDVTIVFDIPAFRAAQVKEVEVLPVQLAKQDPATSLDAVLQQVLKQAGATYLARDSLILVVPRKK